MVGTPEPLLRRGRWVKGRTSKGAGGMILSAETLQNGSSLTIPSATTSLPGRSRSGSSSVADRPESLIMR